MDEFTNSLDPESEGFILKKLQLLKKEKNKNFFIITHKIKPLKLCEEILVLDNGKISKSYNFENFFKELGFLYN